jgi:hypothetical protein
MTKSVVLDLFQQPIKVDDRVIISYDQNCLNYGRVVKVTKKEVTIEHERKGMSWKETSTRTPDNVVVMSEDQRISVAFMKLNS